MATLSTILLGVAVILNGVWMLIATSRIRQLEETVINLYEVGKNGK